MRYAFIVPLLAILLIACNSNEEPTPEGIRNVTSNICDRISGVEGLYWDISNGLSRGDIPGGVPTVAQVGGKFQFLKADYGIIPTTKLYKCNGYNQDNDHGTLYRIRGVRPL